MPTQLKMIKSSSFFSPQESSACAFVLFLGILLFSPLAFGTTESWSLFTVDLLVGLAGFLFLISKPETIPLYRIPGALPLLLLLCWMILQCVPVPPQIVLKLSPNLYSVYKPVLQFSPAADWIPMTVYQKESVLEVLRLASCILLYFLTVHFFSTGRRLHIGVRFVVILAIVISALAIAQKITSPHKIFWFKDVPASAWRGALGPWVYPNHYAGFMVMVVPLVLALFCYHIPVMEESSTIQQKIVDFFSMSAYSFFLAVGLCCIISTLFMSLSRGGILSFAGVMIAFFTLYRINLLKKSGKLTLFLTCGFILIALFLNFSSVLDKILYTFSASDGGIHDGRLLVWQDVLRIISDFPLTGSGFGTFAEIYPQYKGFTDNYIYDHAHNDYLEFVTDGGVVALALFGWFVLSVLQTGLKQIHKRHHVFAILVSIGAFSGIIGMLLYSITDFNLHNGANTLYFFFLCGVLIAAGHTRYHRRVSATTLPRIATQGYRRMAIAGVICFTLLVFWIQGGMLRAEWLYQKVDAVSGSMLRPEKKIKQVSLLLKEAIAVDPFSERYSYALANIKKNANQKEEALELYLLAARKQPLEARFYIAAGQLLISTDPDRSKQLLEIGEQRIPKR